jgi:hypothetical protein
MLRCGVEAAARHSLGAAALKCFILPTCPHVAADIPRFSVARTRGMGECGAAPVASAAFIQTGDKEGSE